MPLTRARRLLVIVAFSCVGHSAVADGPKCPPHGPLRAVVAPAEHDDALAQRTLDQIFSELSARNNACPARSDAPLAIEVSWRPQHRALVRVTLQTPRKELELQRDVDLARVPDDGVPLAVAIVADELLGEIFDRTEIEPPPPVAVAVPAIHRSAPARTPSPSPRSFRFGLRLVHQELTSGLGLSGLDVEVAWRATTHLQLVLRGGLRAPSWIGEARSDARRGWASSALVLVGTSFASSRGVAAALAIDLLGLGGETRASPAVGVSVWQHFADRFVVSFDARMGGVLSDAAEFSALSGACMTFSLGIGTDW
jgi:hypothetical protein